VFDVENRDGDAPGPAVLSRSPHNDVERVARSTVGNDWKRIFILSRPPDSKKKPPQTPGIEHDRSREVPGELVKVAGEIIRETIHRRCSGGRSPWDGAKIVDQSTSGAAGGRGRSSSRPPKVPHYKE